MDESLQLRVEQLKAIKDQLMKDAQCDYHFSKIYLYLSPVTPILVAARYNQLDAKSLLLNYLLIGVPLTALSLILKKRVLPKLDEWDYIAEEMEFCTGIDEDRTEYDQLMNKMISKQKILKKH